ncbi:hypothetical protein [Pseudomonas sp. SO81]|uniref:hypothetical protein n=1 Tax=Pseudomonas sp. SO81 TaxID=2983246 RepID=UPI0025A45A7A|nr:hypothetical protein [Pseudomonas sp. SO81]
MSSFNGRSGTVTLTGSDVTTALGYTPANNASLAGVAFTGAYSDLTGRPVLSAVALSGSYADLSGKPSIPSTPGDIGAATAAQGDKADSAVQPAELASGLADKVDKVTGYGLSQENFTPAEKSKLAGLEGSHFKGLFTSLGALQTAFPTAEAGDYADVDAGVGSETVRYLWDESDTEWIASGSGTPLTAADIKALYESNPDTNAFTDADVTKLSGIAAGATANANTDSLTEGSTNLWFTAARVRAVVLTGLNLTVSAAITAADTVLSALGKLQKQITDHIGSGGSAHANATTSVAGFMSSTDKAKLDGVATSATANSSDAYLLARGNHTGTQAAATISDFSEAVDDRVAGLLVAGSGISLMYNDASNTLTVASSGAASSPVSVISGTTYTGAASDNGKTLVFTNTAAKAATIDPEATTALPNDWELILNNKGASNLTVVAGSGVTITAPAGGSLVIPSGGTGALKRRGADDFFLAGNTL